MNNFHAYMLGHRCLPRPWRAGAWRARRSKKGRHWWNRRTLFDYLKTKSDGCDRRSVLRGHISFGFSPRADVNSRSLVSSSDRIERVRCVLLALCGAPRGAIRGRGRSEERGKHRRGGMILSSLCASIGPCKPERRATSRRRDQPRLQSTS